MDCKCQVSFHLNNVLTGRLLAFSKINQSAKGNIVIQPTAKRTSFQLEGQSFNKAWENAHPTTTKKKKHTQDTIFHHFYTGKTLKAKQHHLFMLAGYSLFLRSQKRIKNKAVNKFILLKQQGTISVLICQNKGHSSIFSVITIKLHHHIQYLLNMKKSKGGMETLNL